MVKKVNVYCHDELAGQLFKISTHGYRFQYSSSYHGAPISLALPVRAEPYDFAGFPPFFDGLLPEGMQLEALIKIRKIDRDDYIRQLIAVGKDLVGAVSVEESHD